MDTPTQKPSFAWQPLTPKGVAAFAAASLSRLLLGQLVFAVLAAAIVVWFLHEQWFPIILEAIKRLPAQGEIRAGTLRIVGETPQRLAEGRFLALALDLRHEGEARTPAHVQIEFGRDDLKIFSLFGYWRSRYPQRQAFAFNRPEVEPWWGAWAPAILAIVAASVIAGLMLSWACLATLYFLPTWLFGFFINRDLSLAGSWRLCSAALMPGALFFTIALLIYGLGGLDLVRLAFAAALHLSVTWLYLFFSPLKLPFHPSTQQPNPFKTPTTNIQHPDKHQQPKLQ